MSCLIVAMLLLHFIMRFRHQRGAPTETQLSIRLAGRQFMMQNVLFVCTIAVLALFMSQLVCPPIYHFMQDAEQS